jgi:plasmid stabilization system protein ParE
VDFEEILTYSRAKFPRNSERFGNAILDLIDLLKSFPYICAVVTYYRVNEGSNFVEILHLWHAKRDLAP